MINPVPTDLFRSVTPHRKRPGHDRDGLIEWYDQWSVYVRYNGDQLARATRRDDLDWLSPDPEAAL